MSESGMTQQAWYFLITVWSIIGFCTLYCFAKIIFSRKKFEAEDEET